MLHGRALLPTWWQLFLHAVHGRQGGNCSYMQFTCSIQIRGGGVTRSQRLCDIFRPHLIALLYYKCIRKQMLCLLKNKGESCLIILGGSWMIIWKDTIGARVVPFCKWAPINLTLSLGEIAVWKIFNCSQCNDTKWKWPKQQTDKGRNKQRNFLLVWDELGWDALQNLNYPQ